MGRFRRKCDARGHTPLELTASNVANSGFLFQSADGAMCYDGVRFRACFSRALMVSSSGMLSSTKQLGPRRAC